MFVSSSFLLTHNTTHWEPATFAGLTYSEGHHHTAHKILHGIPISTKHISLSPFWTLSISCYHQQLLTIQSRHLVSMTLSSVFTQDTLLLQLQTDVLDITSSFSALTGPSFSQHTFVNASNFKHVLLFLPSSTTNSICRSSP